MGVAIVRSGAERCRILDIPNARSSHRRPVPRGGGLAIVVVTLAGTVTSWWHFGPWTSGQVWAMVGSLALVAGVSAFDDVKSVSTSVRLATHSVGAGLVIAAFGAWDVVRLPVAGSIQLGVPGVLVSLIWLVGLTNAYQSMDGIDGMAAGQGIVGGIAWCLFGSLTSQSLVAALGIVLASASLGFLAHNAPPARIFMGDVGSAFLGLSFGALAVACSKQAPALPVCGLLAVWPFAFDATFTLCRRLRLGEPIFQAHRSHLYQRLVISGLSHGRVSALYAALSAAGAALAAAWLVAPSSQGWLVLFAGAMPVVLWLFVLNRERVGSGAPVAGPPRGWPATPFLTQVLHASSCDAN